MGIISMKQLLEAGVHFGHQTVSYTHLDVYKRQLHPFVSHSDAVADTDGGYLNRYTAGSQNSILHHFCLIV